MTFFREELIKQLNRRLRRKVTVPINSWDFIEHKYLKEGCSIVELADYTIKTKNFKEQRVSS